MLCWQHARQHAARRPGGDGAGLQVVLRRRGGPRMRGLLRQKATCTEVVRGLCVHASAPKTEGKGSIQISVSEDTRHSSANHP